VKILVAYYSRTGTTRRLAKALARWLGADCDPITEDGRYAGRLGFGRAYLAGLGHGQCPIHALLDPIPYDHIIIGGPVWAGHVPSPLRQYLTNPAIASRLVGVFCTGWTIADGTGFFAEVERLVGHSRFRRCSLAQRLCDADLYQYPIAKFSRTLFPVLTKSRKNLVIGNLNYALE
jgi:hypothetical protein